MLVQRHGNDVVVLDRFKTKNILLPLSSSVMYTINSLTVNKRKLLVRSCIALYHWLSIAISLYVKLFGRESYEPMMVAALGFVHQQCFYASSGTRDRTQVNLL